MASTKSWGGSWTEQKLEAFEKYVRAYLTIMNTRRGKNNWKLIYFDGFAGSGSRQGDPEEVPNENFAELFPAKEEEMSVYRGAAERVLDVDIPGFDYYYFIDKKQSAVIQLEERLMSYHRSGRRIECRSGDANHQLALLANALEKNPSLKALVLLDPFGMQINWSSIQRLGRNGVDLWILIPTGVIVNRLLDKEGKLTHLEKLKSFFGLDEEAIRSLFYGKDPQLTLFETEEIPFKIEKPIRRIREIYVERLKTVFSYASETPLIMVNRCNCPIYHFACASNNKTAVDIATDIIDSIHRK